MNGENKNGSFRENGGTRRVWVADPYVMMPAYQFVVQYSIVPLPPPSFV